MEKILEVVKGCIRPFITVTGWMTALGLTIWLVIEFKDKEIAMMIIGPIIGAIIAAVNYWLGQRSATKTTP